MLKTLVNISLLFASRKAHHYEDDEDKNKPHFNDLSSTVCMKVLSQF